MQTHSDNGVQFGNGKPFGQPVLKRTLFDAEDGIERVGKQRVDNGLFAAFLFSVVNVFHVHFLTVPIALGKPKHIFL